MSLCVYCAKVVVVVVVDVFVVIVASLRDDVFVAAVVVVIVHMTHTNKRKRTAVCGGYAATGHTGRAAVGTVSPI